MFKHNVKYVDFNGDEQQEDLHFHLSLPEVTRIEAEVGTDLATHTKAIVDAQDPKAMIGFLERIVLSSYGKKSVDGRSFRKSAELKEDFEQSTAYAEFFEELLTVPGLAQKFGEGVVVNSKTRKNTVDPKLVKE